MKKIIYIILSLSFILLHNCKEPYEAETNTFEEALVVESTITNENKRQKVKLSRVIRLEENGINPEKNAQVWIEDSNNNRYDFLETTPGIYLSENEFMAILNIEYKLYINTQNGNSYQSRGVNLTVESPFEELYALKETVNEKLGIQVYIDNTNNNTAKYFRYEFVETYKIITPFWITNEIDVANVVYNPTAGLGVPDYTYDIITTPRTEEKRICYASNTHKKILQTNASNNLENNIIRFPIRFIEKEDAIIRNRYSILVKQYVQSYDSYNFYKTLNDLGSVTSLISETQTGFVQGNIHADTKEKIIGFFDVSSKSEKRIYFNYTDFDLTKPKYQYECKTDTLDYDIFEIGRNGEGGDRTKLIEKITGNFPEHYPEKYQLVNQVNLHTYIMITPRCGDCTIFSSNTRPDFWID